MPRSTAYQSHCRVVDFFHKMHDPWTHNSVCVRRILHFTFISHAQWLCNLDISYAPVGYFVCSVWVTRRANAAFVVVVAFRLTTESRASEARRFRLTHLRWARLTSAMAFLLLHTTTRSNFRSHSWTHTHTHIYTEIYTPSTRDIYTLYILSRRLHIESVTNTFLSSTRTKWV